MEENVRHILEGLNPAQKAAVEQVEGPALIIAGAGSGKTRVLTAKVAYILAQGVDPSRILALTFTKKAAAEMKERIAALVGPAKARKVVMGTFHSIFIRFLRDYAASLGYPEQFTIYDTGDSISAIKACLKELELDEKIYKPKSVLSRISRVKNDLVLPQEYRMRPEFAQADLRGSMPRLVEVYERYQARMKMSGVMDFDDILVQMNVLLRDNPQALSAIGSRFSYILVDEYQDTNFAQYTILRKLAAQHRNICVVGDDSQSIYAFRGARVENILNFRKDYPEYRIFRLEQNYRSTANIVSAANSVIARNESRIPKECFSAAGDGEKIRLTSASDANMEGALIASSIINRIGSAGARYSDFAVLYRTNAQSRNIEEALRKRNIPYMIYSGNSFYERAEVKDFMAYFKLAVNPNDDESFRRVYNKPARGIGEGSFELLENASKALGCSFFKTVYSPGVEAVLPSKVLGKIKVVADMIKGWAEAVGSAGAAELARRIAGESGLYEFYKADNSIEGLARTANVNELLDSVSVFESESAQEYLDNTQETPDQVEVPVFHLDEYLESTALLTGVDASEREGEDASNKVALMTVHSAKGLEFPYVYIAGMEEHLFPSYQESLSKSDLEEERRLFYVALTRAKTAVTLSYAHERMRNGSHQSYSVSRFIKEIDPKYIDNPLRESSVDFAFGGFGSRFGSGAPRPYGGSRPAGGPFGAGGSRPAPMPGRTGSPSAPRSAANPNFVPSDPFSLKPGDKVEHLSFGTGKILSLDTSRLPDLYARVKFDLLGEKQLNLSKAKLRKL